MGTLSRKLDNTAKVLSLDEKKLPNKYRFSAVMKEKVDPKYLKSAIKMTLEMYPSYKVKLKSGLLWYYLENNFNDVIVEENKTSYRKNKFKNNNEYLFKVSYYNKKINLDILHVLTDGLGAITFLKSIIYNYLNLKHNLKTELIVNDNYEGDAYLKNADKKLVYKNTDNKAFTIKEKSDIFNNKTYHYILDLEKFKKICKKSDASITEYLSALHIYTIYKTVYDKSSKKDIAITVPIDLRKFYKVKSLSNFFTCMKINGNILGKENISFSSILKQVKKEFKNKGTESNVKKYLAKDVKLGTNPVINIVPLFIKKIFMRYIGKLANKTTTTLSNVGPISLDEQYKKYVDNVMVLVSTGRVQKVKCTICSYENNLTVTINSNLITNKFENEFSRLLKQHVGSFKLEQE